MEFMNDLKEVFNNIKNLNQYIWIQEKTPNEKGHLVPYYNI